MKVRRKIMALGTALAMAFVMIASLVMVTDVKADNDPTPITSVNVSIKVPEANTVIKKVAKESDGFTYYVQEPRPEFTVSGEGFEQIEEANAWIVDPDNILVQDQEFWDLDSNNWFTGTLEAGKDYYAVVELSTMEYTWTDTCDVNVTGGTFVKYMKNPGQWSGNAYVVVKVNIPGGDDPSPTPTPSSEVPTISDGSTVEVAPAEDGTVTFRFEKDLEYFENGGKLYIDGQEVPADMYKATRGSTIITLFKEYAAKLADGAEHAVKVVFNDNTSVEGKIVVKAASSDSSASTAASGTSGTASSTAATTTTKATAAKTADALPYAGLALVFVGATAIGVIAIRRKNS